MHERYGISIPISFSQQPLTIKLGPIVRIRPDTVHINDAAFIDQVFGTTGIKRDKTQLHCNSFVIPDAFISTVSHDLHRARRAPMSNFFSKASIRRLEPTLHSCLTKVLSILDAHKLTKKPVNMKTLFAALTSDMITEYSFGTSWNSLDAENLNEPIFRILHDGTFICHLSSYLPFVATTLRRSLPDQFAIWLMPDMKILLRFFDVCTSSVIII